MKKTLLYTLKKLQKEEEKNNKLKQCIIHTRDKIIFESTPYQHWLKTFSLSHSASV